MANENKLLLLLDLTPRLTYGVICHTEKGDGYLCSINQTIFGNEYGININPLKRDYFNDGDSEEVIVKPYLRPLSTMTKDEYYEYEKFILEEKDETIKFCNSLRFYGKYHFDYRGMIEKGLALVATEDMYKTD